MNIPFGMINNWLEYLLLMTFSSAFCSLANLLPLSFQLNPLSSALRNIIIISKYT